MKKTALFTVPELLRNFSFSGLVLVAHLYILLGTHLYDRFGFTDILFHFLGGLSIGQGFVISFEDLSRRKILVITAQLIRVLSVVASVALAAVVWEFHEFLFDYFLGTHMQPSIQDTMADLFLGLCGGLTAAFIFYKQTK